MLWNGTAFNFETVMDVRATKNMAEIYVDGIIFANRFHETGSL